MSSAERTTLYIQPDYHLERAENSLIFYQMSIGVEALRNLDSIQNLSSLAEINAMKERLATAETIRVKLVELVDTIKRESKKRAARVARLKPTVIFDERSNEAVIANIATFGDNLDALNREAAPELYWAMKHDVPIVGIDNGYLRVHRKTTLEFDFKKIPPEKKQIVRGWLSKYARSIDDMREHYMADELVNHLSLHPESEKPLAVLGADHVERVVSRVRRKVSETGLELKVSIKPTHPTLDSTNDEAMKAVESYLASASSVSPKA